MMPIDSASSPVDVERDDAAREAGEALRDEELPAAGATDRPILPRPCWAKGAAVSPRVSASTGA